MKVVLLQDVKNIGKKHQTVEVSDGYAMNFLIPKKLAQVESKAINDLVRKEQIDRAITEKDLLHKAQELKAKIEALSFKLTTKTGLNGKLFGAISNKQIADKLLVEHKINVDKKKIVIKEPITKVGIYPVIIELHKDVKATLTMEVVDATK